MCHVQEQKLSSVDALRYYLLSFSSRIDTDDLYFIANLDRSTMSPSKDCLIEHIKRANSQVRIWRLANIAISDIPKPWEEHG